MALERYKLAGRLIVFHPELAACFQRGNICFERSYAIGIVGIANKGKVLIGFFVMTIGIEGQRYAVVGGPPLVPYIGYHQAYFSRCAMQPKPPAVGYHVVFEMSHRSFNL